MNRLNATRKGLIVGCLIIVLQLFFFYVLKQQTNSRYQFIVYAVFAASILWSVLSFAKSATATAKLSEYFSTGFKTFIAITLLIVLYTFIFYSIHTEIRDAEMALNNKLLQQEGNHTSMEIEANAKQLKSIFMPMMLGITTFLYLLLGSVITLLSSIVIIQLKKR